MLATMEKRATNDSTAKAATLTDRLPPSKRRKMSAAATALARTRNGTKSPKYLGEMYPHNISAAPALPAARRSRRVLATWPTGLGRNAVTRPQRLSKKSRGVDAGKLAVR